MKEIKPSCRGAWGLVSGCEKTAVWLLVRTGRCSSTTAHGPPLHLSHHRLLRLVGPQPLLLLEARRHVLVHSRETCVHHLVHFLLVVLDLLQALLHFSGLSDDEDNVFCCLFTRDDGICSHSPKENRI